MIVSFAVQKLWSLIRFHLSTLAFGVLVMKSLLMPAISFERFLFDSEQKLKSLGFSVISFSGLAATCHYHSDITNVPSYSSSVTIAVSQTYSESFSFTMLSLAFPFTRNHFLPDIHIHFFLNHLPIFAYISFFLEIH